MLRYPFFIAASLAVSFVIDYNLDREFYAQQRDIFYDLPDHWRTMIILGVLPVFALSTNALILFAKSVRGFFKKEVSDKVMLLGGFYVLGEFFLHGSSWAWFAVMICISVAIDTAIVAISEKRISR